MSLSENGASSAMGDYLYCCRMSGVGAQAGNPAGFVCSRDHGADVAADRPAAGKTVALPAAVAAGAAGLVVLVHEASDIAERAGEQLPVRGERVRISYAVPRDGAAQD